MHLENEFLIFIWTSILKIHIWSFYHDPNSLDDSLADLILNESKNGSFENLRNSHAKLSIPNFAPLKICVRGRIFWLQEF